MSCLGCANGCNQCTGYQHRRYAGLSAAFNDFKLKNPIPDEVCDSKLIRRFFKDYDLVPYAGMPNDSQHNFLRFIETLSTLSPTLGGCISSMSFCCFGGKIDIVRKSDNDFDLGESVQTDVSDLLKKEYVKHLRTFFEIQGVGNWNKLHEELFRSLRRNGNAYLHVKITQTMGQRKAYFIPRPQEHCLYRVKNLIDPDLIYISKQWDREYLKNNPPFPVPIYPQYTEDKQGTIHTIIHLKEGLRDYYGRPTWWSCAYDAYLEIKNKEYLLKAAHNNFTGQVLIEFEGDQATPSTATDPNDDNKKNYTEKHWARSFTNRNGEDEERQSIYITERPFEAKPAFVHEFRIQTNENYFKTVDELTEKNIIMANSWSPKLLGIESKGGLSNNTFVDDLKTKLSVIESHQQSISGNMINVAIDFVNNIIGTQQYSELGLAPKNPFDHLLQVAEEHNQNKNDIANPSTGSIKV